ncbi:MAG: VRR-NUC domain-containing protein, partial [Telluria sp.]
MRKVLENEFYYLDNFHRVLEWIAERYDDLLLDDERAFIALFATLPQNARALLVRMVMRKGTLFRASKLNYAEIGCPVEAARHLLPTGWVASDPVISLDALFDLLLKKELAAVFHLSLHEKGARKAEQLSALRTEFSDARAFSHWCRDSTDVVYSIRIKPLCDRLRLIFFGNLRQDWTEFVLSDLGVFKFEKVEFSPLARGFRHRGDVDDYLALHACKERFHAGEALDAVLQALPADAVDNDWLDSRRERLLFQIAQHVEKQKDWTGAVDLYARCRFPGARARAIRVLEKDQQYGRAFTLLSAAQQAPESDA